MYGVRCAERVGITVGAAAYREMCYDANYVGFRERNFYLKIAFCIAFT